LGLEINYGIEEELSHHH